MGKKSSKSSDPPSPQKPKKSHKKSETSNLEHSESNMDLKTGDLKHSPTLISSPAAPKSPKPLTANPKSSKLATPAKEAGIVDEDAILILENVVQFMSGNGGKTPTETSIKPLFESINNFLTQKVSTGNQLYCRIRNLKNKYFRLIENKVDIDSPELSTFVDLGAKIWGHANEYDVKGNIGNGNGSKGKRMKLEEDEISEEKTKKLKVEENDDDDNNDVKGNIVNGNGSKSKRMKLEEYEISEEKIKKLKVEENDDDDNNDVKGNIVNGNGSKGKIMKLEEDEISEEKTKKLKVEENDDHDNNNDKDDEDDDENGSDDKDDEDDDENGSEIDDAKNGDMFPIMYEQVKVLWMEEGYSMDDLERGFESIDKLKCKKFEKKWKELIVKDMELKIEELKTDVEIITMVSKMI